MVTKEQSIKKFSESAKEAASAHYLFASKKIKEMMEVLFSSQLLTEVVEYCCLSEDVEKLRKTCFVSADNTGGFILPKSNRQVIAICTYILKGVVDGTINFNNLLAKYFAQDGKALSGYSSFASEVILRFRDLVVDMAGHVITAVNMQEGRNERFSEDKPNMELQYLQGLIALLEEEKRMIESVMDSAYSEILWVDDAMLKAAKDLDTEALRPLAVAYKHVPRKKIKTKYDEVMELLIDHGVVIK